MTPFSTLIDMLSPTPGGFAVDPGEDWRQGRTLYGGAGAALCLRACERAAAGALPPLRSAQIAFIGPAAGPLTLRPMLLRQGKSTTFIACDLTADGALATRALFCFGAARTSAYDRRASPAPDASAPEACGDFFGGGPGPAFAAHFDMRRAAGSAPMTGGAPEYLLWGRHRDPDAPAGAVSLLALADAPPPAAMSAFSAPAMISTMTWMIDVLDPEALAASGFMLLHARAETMAEGYSAQAMAIWTQAGAPVLIGRQTVAIFG